MNSPAPLRKHRQDCLPHETARQLLTYDRPGHTALIGIDYGAEKAILYHERDGYVIAIEFGPNGLADGGPEIADIRSGTSIQTWIQKMDGYWSWVHPQYR